MNIRGWLLDQINDFISINGREPSTIYLTPEQEAEFGKLTRDEIGGDLADAIQQNGVRQALSAFDGKTLVWGADKFGLE